MLLEEGLDFRGSRAEGSGLAPVGSTVCKWGTNKIRVAVKLETSGSGLGGRRGPVRACCSIKTEVCFHLVNEERTR